MTRVALQAQEREILGKKVKILRREGIIPAHVFGKKIETEHVSVNRLEFLKVFEQVGETGLVDLKIGSEKVRPVLIRDIQVDPVREEPLHIDFYQVNLMEKVKVRVPIYLRGEEPELVHTGEAVVIQQMPEVEVEALPTDLPENIEVDISVLKNIDDTVYISDLKVPQGVEVQADAEWVVVKLDKAVSEEAEALMEEMEKEAEVVEEAAKEGAEAVTEEGVEEGAEGTKEEEAGESEEKKE
ncbi:MAG: 50S ribosomal protein L25 [Armatimonadetes bacterium]|nr:MAG: 50S ribosomal protein L25 [Armatimonadota bacterium]